MPRHFKPPSTIYQRIGDVGAVVIASPGCEQLKETSRLRTTWRITHKHSSWNHVDETAILWEEQATG